MNLTQFTIQKDHSRATHFSVSMHSTVPYTASTSQPQTEVTAHTDVRRRYSSRFAPSSAAMMAWMLMSGAGSIGCTRQPTQPPATATPQQIQVLVQAGPALNLGDDGQPWPTAWTLYQLRADPEGPDREPLEPAAVLADPDAALADLRLAQHDHTAFPATATRLVVELAPETTHLLALARFREPIGDASYLVYPVPRRPEPAPRDAACFYLGLDRSELDGGPFPPPGFDAAAFATTCPPAATR